MRRPPEQVERLTDPQYRRFELEATMWVAVMAYDKGTHRIEHIIGSMRDLLADIKIADDARDMALCWDGDSK